ncbi:MAG: asparagine synthase (glutamine-hydrolyzing) [Pirellulaceae bacterium]
MCGIAGYSGSFTEASLQDAVAAMRHRGPDDEGIYCSARHSIGLGHTRLSIMDPSPLGHQPMVSPDDRVVLVYNGEIYNHKELRVGLEQKGYAFRSQCDTEVLLHLYRDCGEQMLPRLNGIFALAIWDEQKQSLFVARDAIGVKPLYLTQTDRGVAFAIEIKALLRIAPESRQIDIAALQRYLTFLWCPGGGTPLRNVRRLGPGESLWITQGQVTSHRKWYHLPHVRGVQPDLSAAESVTQLSSTLQSAVQRQLLSDVPVGAFLSGGLDSSSLVSMARESIPRLACFTIDVQGESERGTADDLPYAQAVAAHLGVPLHPVRIDSSTMADHLEIMVRDLDEPIADPAALNVRFISQLARQMGYKVLLSGTGGDDLFSGYRRHQVASWMSNWKWVPKSVRSGLERISASMDQRRPMLRRMAKLFNGLQLEGDQLLVNYLRWSRPERVEGLFSAEARHQIAGQDAATPMIDFLSDMPQKATTLQRQLAMEQQFFLGDHNLIYTDKMSMAVGVEVRVPFLDLELVELAGRIPDHGKIQRGVLKWVLKEAVKDRLPRNVIHRPKTGFGAPVRRWIQGRWRPLIHDYLGEANLTRRGIFDPHAVNALVTANESGTIDASYTVLSLLCIEIWMRQFVDQTP